MDQEIVLGIDIGGSHITAAPVSLQTRAVVKGIPVRSHVDARGTADGIIDAWAGVIDDCFRQHNMTAKRIGIAMPGPFDYEQGISLMKNQDKYDALYGLNVKELLADRLGITPGQIRFMNDAGCFLQGEVFGGAARGHSDVIGITLGTGLGSARYHNGLAQDADLWCMPFEGGIAEDFLCTRWFVKRYEELSGNQVANVKELAGYLNGHGPATQVFEEFGHNLALFLESFIRMDQPEVIVVGGNIANAAERFFPVIQTYLQEKDIHIGLCQASLGETAAIIGAASCWYHA